MSHHLGILVHYGNMNCHIKLDKQSSLQNLVTEVKHVTEHVKKISVRAQLISNPFHLLCLRCTCHQYKSNTREILATPPRTTPAIFPLLSYIGSHVKLLCAASCLHSLLRCTANAILKLG